VVGIAATLVEMAIREAGNRFLGLGFTLRFEKKSQRRLQNYVVSCWHGMCQCRQLKNGLWLFVSAACLLFLLR
jgi:hypothetical protein